MKRFKLFTVGGLALATVAGVFCSLGVMLASVIVRADLGQSRLAALLAASVLYFSFQVWQVGRDSWLIREARDLFLAMSYKRRSP